MYHPVFAEVAAVTDNDICVIQRKLMWNPFIFSLSDVLFLAFFLPFLGTGACPVILAPLLEWLPWSSSNFHFMLFFLMFWTWKLHSFYSSIQLICLPDNWPKYLKRKMKFIQKFITLKTKTLYHM